MVNIFNLLIIKFDFKQKGEITGEYFWANTGWESIYGSHLLIPKCDHIDC